MFIKRTRRTHKDKTYDSYLLVESVATRKGPRHKVICSLGSLAPAPKEEWVALAHRMQAALAGQAALFAEAQVDAMVEKRTGARRSKRAAEMISLDPERIEVEQVREAGPVHAGHQMWKKLQLDVVLEELGLKAPARLLTEVMVLNRLIAPASEHAMPNWIARSAMADILGADLTELNDDRLYRHLDRLYPLREKIEAALVERERTLFNLGETLYLYDLTSTYFEGHARANPKAKRGYSRDHRPDCKQVVVGLVLDQEGFPKAHEVFEGNLLDHQSVSGMLDRLEARVGKRQGATVVVDRGMAVKQTLAMIQARGYHYLVAGRPAERLAYLEEFEDEAGWEEVIRQPSPRNPGQKKTAIALKRCVAEAEVHVLCKSAERVDKDRAIRESHEKRLVADVKKLALRVRKGQLTGDKVHEAIGRLKERYPRVARYYEMRYDPQHSELIARENEAAKEKAKRLDGGYLIRTDRTDIPAQEMWSFYMLLTRVENAFRDMKGPLLERPIFHHLERRVETHIFLCVLAYHLLVCIERRFLDAGRHTSWEAIRDALSTHQVVTIVLPTDQGETLKIRKGSTPEDSHQEIYRILNIPELVMTPIKTWVR
jgi:transposase